MTKLNLFTSHFVDVFENAMNAYCEKFSEIREMMAELSSAVQDLISADIDMEIPLPIDEATVRKYWKWLLNDALVDVRDVASYDSVIEQLEKYKKQGIVPGDILRSVYIPKVGDGERAYIMFGLFWSIPWINIRDVNYDPIDSLDWIKKQCCDEYFSMYTLFGDFLKLVGKYSLLLNKLDASFIKFEHSGLPRSWGNQHENAVKFYELYSNFQKQCYDNSLVIHNLDKTFPIRVAELIKKDNPIPVEFVEVHLKETDPKLDTLKPENCDLISKFACFTISGSTRTQENGNN